MLLGLYADNGNFSPISVWPDVGYGNPFRLVWVFNVQHLHLSLRRYGASADIQFIPKISIFAATQFVGEGQLLPDLIDSLIWYHDLSDVNLPTSLVLDLSWNASSSKFVLTLPETLVGLESTYAVSRSALDGNGSNTHFLALLSWTIQVFVTFFAAFIP